MFSRLSICKHHSVTTTKNLHSSTKTIKSKRGVRHGDTISQKLLITVVEHVLKALSWKQKGINIDGEYLNRHGPDRRG